MPTFYYKAVNASGEVQEGELSVANQQLILARLQKQGLTPIRIDELSAQKQKEKQQQKIKTTSKKIKKKAIKPDDIRVFTDDLSTLLNAGMPLDRAFDILIDLAENAQMQTVLTNIRDNVMGGSSLAEAMEAEKGVFSRFYLNMIRAGEAGSAIDKVLVRLTEFLERSAELKETVKSALIYPIILLSVAGLSVIILLTFVVPQFSQMFEDAGKALPLPTQIVIGMGAFFQEYWWAVAFAIIGIIYFFKKQFANPETKRFWDAKLLKFSLVGDLITKIEVARFTRTLGTLLENGVPLLSALSIMKDTMSNLVMADSIGRVTQSLKEGRSLTEPLQAEGYFPKMAVQMVRVGEETGQLTEMLVKVANIYDKEVRNAVQRMLSLLEPILILGLGVVIAGIIFSILIAILSVNDLTV